jgi:hypothetical protein
MVCFQTKNPNLGKFWMVLLWKILVYFMTIWSIVWPLEIFYGFLVYFVAIWYIFPRFGILDQEKSGITAPGPKLGVLALERWLFLSQWYVLSHLLKKCYRFISLFKCFY